MYAKREVKIMINKGMTSFFIYKFLQITDRKTLKNIFNAHVQFYIFVNYIPLRF